MIRTYGPTTTNRPRFLQQEVTQAERIVPERQNIRPGVALGRGRVGQFPNATSQASLQLLADGRTAVIVRV